MSTPNERKRLLPGIQGLWHLSWWWSDLRYFCCSIACGEVTQGNSCQGKGATNCCSYHKTTACTEAQSTLWLVLNTYLIETQRSAFLVPTLEISPFYEWKCTWTVRSNNLLDSQGWLARLHRSRTLQMVVSQKVTIALSKASWDPRTKARHRCWKHIFYCCWQVLHFTLLGQAGPARCIYKKTETWAGLLQSWVQR